MILSDNDATVDLLNNEAIAKTIVSLVEDSKEQPISIGIHGNCRYLHALRLKEKEHTNEKNSVLWRYLSF